jgi:hypothetical protein
MLQKHLGLLKHSSHAGCAPDSRLLNSVVQVLLEEDVVGAGFYLAKINEKKFSRETSTTELLISLFSDGTCQKQIGLLPAKYQFLLGASHG